MERKKLAYSSPILLEDEENGQSMMIGWSFVEALNELHRLGSITKVAAALGVSYRWLRDRLERLERLTGMTIHTSQAGGPTGGGTALTAYGRHVADRLGEKLTELEALGPVNLEAE